MISDLRNAFAFLMILPVDFDDRVPPGRSFAYYPLVGLVIGIILSLTAYAASQWLSPQITAFCVLLVWIVLTGGLHLDGFGDSCDGLFAIVEPERRLEIMKDSRAGSWAVMGLILLLLGKWLALLTIGPEMLILVPVMGRWSMVIAVYAFPYARVSGIGAHFRNGFTRQQLLLASLIAMMVGVGWGLVIDNRVLILIPVVPVIVWLTGRWAARRLGGGLTGDVYGALCELIELVTLLLVGVL